jgi:LPXTG-site transpeptidase (sortase) family protein
MVDGSTLPDVVNGNLILMAHSGDAYISYFAYLYKLNVGDPVYVTYNGRKYKYQIVNIYDVEKNGLVRIMRNYDRTSLTLITCTKNNDNSQTIYISELVG